MDNTAKLNSMASDLHLITAPFRFLFAALKVLLFTVSFPFLCGLMLVSYALPHIDPLQRYLDYWHAHNIPLVAYPFILLGAFLLLAMDMLLIITKDLGGMVDVLFRLIPILGTTLFALASTFWFIVVRGVYRHRDGEQTNGWSSLFIGFTVSFVAGMYVSACEESLPPATLLGFATLAAFSPTLLYLLYRGLKPTRQEAQ